ncbi:MAG: PLP-dependent aminotransferase family protein [Ilumatobacteraceae bacterium]
MGDSETGAQLLAAEAARRAALPDVQYEHTGGVIDLTWGHPDPSTLATGAVAEATAAVLGSHGWQSLTYGAPCGGGYVREAVAQLLTRTDAPVEGRNVIIMGGSSGGLDVLLTVLAVPGDVVFVEQPTYFLALRMFADHGLRVIGLVSDALGPSTDEFARRAALAVADGRRAFLYLVPTFANPTGRCLPVQRQLELLDAARRHGVHVIEDDVYRDTSVVAPASMWSHDRDTVLRLGSFSKSLSPGLRVGYLTAGAELVERLGGCGLLDSGGGVNHFAAMVVGELLHSGRFAQIADAASLRYARRRAALAAALDPRLFEFSVPDGGYFLWLGLPPGVSSARAVAAAQANGVLVAGARSFFVDEPDGGFLRLSFSMLDETGLVDGAARLNEAVAALVG